MERCPGCGKPVAEADMTCPHCGRDFSAPVVRKPVPKEPPPPEKKPKFRLEEDEPPAPAPEPAPPARAPEAKPAAKKEEKPAKPAPKLEDAPPPAASGGFEPTPFDSPGIDNPPAYDPGASSGTVRDDPYVVRKEESRPPWQWLGMAILCGVAFKLFAGRPQPAPPPPPAPPPAAAAPQPSAPAHLPGDVVGAVKAVGDARDAAAAATAAMDPSLAAIHAAPPAEPPPARPKARPRPAPPPEAPDPDDVDRTPDDSPIVITQTGVEEPPERPRRGGAKNSNEWRMRGVIHDILTGDPIKNADVVFMDAKTGRRFATGTDAQGRYRATLPLSAEGFDLTIRHPRYEPKYFEDGIPAYRELGLEQRQSAASDLLRILQQKELIVGVGGTVIERDFVLIPLNR